MSSYKTNVEKLVIISHLSLCNIIPLIRKVPAFLDHRTNAAKLEKTNKQTPCKSLGSPQTRSPNHFIQTELLGQGDEHKLQKEKKKKRNSRKHQYSASPELLPGFLQTYARVLSSNGSINTQRSTAQNYPT